MAVNITYFGHSGFLIAGDEHSIAVDPFLTDNPVATIKADEVECDFIGVTHGHEDHVGDTEKIAKANGATVIAAFELAEHYLEKKGVHCEAANPGGRVQTPFGWVALTKAFHSSSYNGQYMGQPCGLVIHIDGVTLYHCGDTDIFGDMNLIGEIYKPDIAMIPIGDRFTMGPALATRAAEMIRPTFAIPIHYNTWPPIEQDPNEFKPQGVEVKIMKPGETWAFAEKMAAAQ